MNADLLLENFHVLAEAHGGVQTLRQFIIDLSVRGKIVPQDPNEEPAEHLLARNASAKAKLVAEGIRKEKPLPAIEMRETPHLLPSNWKWARLGDATSYGYREIAEDVRDDTWVLDLEDIEKDTSRILSKARFKDRASKSDKSAFKKNDVLYGKLRPYLNKVVVADEDGICTTEIVPMRTFVPFNSRFITFCLKRSDFLGYVNSKSYGMKMPRLGTDDARMALIPVAPLNEQRRIVAKVDQLMALCDELEKRQEKKHFVSIQLNESALNKLTTAHTQVEFSGDWQRIKQNFDLLYDIPENVDKLKQAILQLAVQGKLVPQDPNDQPASVLLEKIKAEKERLITAEKLKPSKPLPPISPDEVPFELPKGWVWVRVGQVANTIRYGYTASADHNLSGIRLLRITDIQDSIVNWDNVPGCEIADKDFENYGLSVGDIVIARTGGTIGKSFLVRELPVKAVFASYLIRLAINGELLAEYSKVFLDSSLYWKQLYKKSMGTGQPNVNGTSLGELLMPLPPRKEQNRIVAKVNDLMLVFYQLEIKLHHTQSAAERLVEGVVRGLSTG